MDNYINNIINNIPSKIKDLKIFLCYDDRDKPSYINYDKVINIKELMYVWNRMNNTNSVSIVRDKIWEASAYKHIGQQLMLIQRLKHKEMIPKIEERIKVCIDKCNKGTYQQY